MTSKLLGTITLSMGWAAIIVERLTTRNVPDMIFHLATMLTGAAILTMAKSKER